MTRVTRYTYDVRRKEKVTFHVTPLDGATPKVTAGQNGQTVPNSGPAGKPRFEVLCDEVVGNNHFVEIEYTFLAGDPAGAEFRTRVRSSDGDEFDDIPNIKKKNSARVRNFTLRVRS